MLRSRTTISTSQGTHMAPLPTHRPATHPGEILTHEFLVPYEMTQVELAERLAIPFQRVNQIVRGRRAVTPDTALRLSKLFGTTAQFWLNLQQAWDLTTALQSPTARQIRQIRPLSRKRARAAS
jgi:addiction module HigA family antidote